MNLLSELKSFISAVVASMLPTDYYSVQTSSSNPINQQIPNKTWTVVEFGDNAKINENVGGGADRIIQGKPDFIAGDDGRYLMTTYLRMSGGTSGQLIYRFIREYDTTQDHFGTDERNLTTGRNFISHSYPAGLGKGRRIAIQVWQDSGSDMTIEFAQFKMVQIQKT